MSNTSRSDRKETMKAGWPDEFVKNVAQNVAQYIFVKIIA
jgi:hypothetical protein